MKKNHQLNLVQLLERCALIDQESPKYVTTNYAPILELMKQLQPAVLNELTALFDPLYFSRAKEMQAPNSTIKHLWLLEEGISYCYIMANDKEQVHCFHFPGELTGHYSTGSLRNTHAMGIKSLSKVHCWRVDIDELNALCQIYPSLQSLIVQLFKGKMNWLQQMQCFKLLPSPRERYQILLKEFPSYFQKIPLKYLASYLQIDPSTLTRYRHMK